MSSICCTEQREVVVGVERAAVDLGPAVLAGQPVAGRLVALGARERVADALHALVVVGRRGAARLDADRAALRLDLLRELGEVDADVVVVRADIGDAQRLVLRRAGRSPRSGPGCRPPWPLQRLAHGGRVGRARRRCRRPSWRSGRCTIWTCSSPPPCSPGPIYRHSNAPFSSFSAFLQPSRAWSKNGLFMFFGTSAKTYFLPARRGAAARRPRAPTATTPRSADIFIIAFPPVGCVTTRRGAGFRVSSRRFRGSARAEPRE